MHNNIEKELLIARLHYLEAMKSKPGSPEVPQIVLDKVQEHIKSGTVDTYMGVESLFNYLIEKLPGDKEKADELSREILSFIEQ